MPDSVEDFLEEIEEINFMYNNASKHDSMIYCYNKIIDDILDFIANYTCTNSFDLAAEIEKKFKLVRGK